MTREQKDEAMDEIYEFAMRVCQRLGRFPIEDDTADELIDAIGEYLGEPDGE